MLVRLAFTLGLLLAAAFAWDRASPVERGVLAAARRQLDQAGPDKEDAIDRKFEAQPSVEEPEADEGGGAEEEETDRDILESVLARSQETKSTEEKLVEEIALLHRELKAARAEIQQVKREMS